MKLLIIVNSGHEKPFNQYAAYVVAFLAKRANVEDVTVFYGPHGVEMSKRGMLAKLTIEDSVKKLIADQLEGVEASALPDNLAEFAKFLKANMGVNIYSCGTFHVIAGFAETIEDKSNVEDFVDPVHLPEAAKAIMEADKILYY